MNLDSAAVIELLKSSSPRAEAVFLAVSALGAARTRDISNYVGLDNANVTRRLEALEAAGRVVVINAHDVIGRGRPSRVWAVAPQKKGKKK